MCCINFMHIRHIKIVKNPKFFRKNFSRINWGMNIFKTGCLFHRILTWEEFRVILGIFRFISVVSETLLVSTILIVHFRLENDQHKLDILTREFTIHSNESLQGYSNRNGPTKMGKSMKTGKVSGSLDGKTFLTGKASIDNSCLIFTASLMILMTRSFYLITINQRALIPHFVIDLQGLRWSSRAAICCFEPLEDEFANGSG